MESHEIRPHHYSYIIYFYGANFILKKICTQFAHDFVHYVQRVTISCYANNIIFLVIYLFYFI
jgi:hypothetical protein